MKSATRTRRRPLRPGRGPLRPGRGPLRPGRGLLRLGRGRPRCGPPRPLRRDRFSSAPRSVLPQPSSSSTSTPPTRSSRGAVPRRHRSRI
ncbi:MAG: hypothetical protein DI576_10495 [Actinomyces sp.]|nr:MAG: hypothetical protein DI576_10495 [Actinomyces sp.]